MNVLSLQEKLQAGICLEEPITSTDTGSRGAIIIEWNRQSASGRSAGLGSMIFGMQKYIPRVRRRDIEDCSRLKATPISSRFSKDCTFRTLRQKFRRTYAVLVREERHGEHGISGEELRAFFNSHIRGSGRKDDSGSNGSVAAEA